MLSIIDVVTCGNFKERLNSNQALFGLLLRQGGYEGFMRSLIGASLQLKNPTLTYISEKYRYDLLLSDSEGRIVLAVEFKHNFIHQRDFSFSNFMSAISQNDEVNCDERVQRSNSYNREVVYFVTQLTSNNHPIPRCYEKNDSNKVLPRKDAEDLIEKAKKWKYAGYVFNSCSPVFDFKCTDILTVKLHVLVYQKLGNEPAESSNDAVRN